MATAKKTPSGKWRCLAYIGKDENGKRQYKSFTAASKKEAEFQATLFLTNKQYEENSMTISKAVAEYITSKENVLSPSTIEGYRNVERNRLSEIADIEIADFDTITAQKYINEMARRLSAKSVANAWGLVAAAIKQQAPEKVLTVTLPSKKKRVRELPTAAEVIAAVKGTDVELPALLAMWLSLRMSEVRGLKYKDVRDGVLTVRRTILTVDGEHIIREQNKTYESTRRLTLSPYLEELIGTGAPDDFIVPMTGETIYKHFVRAIEAAGLPHMRFHDLRHLSASVLVSLGIPNLYSRERGGWSTDSILESVYQHTFSADRAAVDTKVNDYFEGLLSLKTNSSLNKGFQ